MFFFNENWTGLLVRSCRKVKFGRQSSTLPVGINVFTICVWCDVQIGRTENVQNSLSPDFAKSFTVDYMFEQVQKVSVAVYDIDNSTPKLSDDDFLGHIETTLGQVNFPFALFDFKQTLE